MHSTASVKTNDSTRSLSRLSTEVINKMDLVLDLWFSLSVFETNFIQLMTLRYMCVLPSYQNLSRRDGHPGGC